MLNSLYELESLNPERKRRNSISSKTTVMKSWIQPIFYWDTNIIFVSKLGYQNELFEAEKIEYYRKISR